MTSRSVLRRAARCGRSSGHASPDFADLRALEKALERKYKGVTVIFGQDDRHIIWGLLEVSRRKQRQGLGSAVVREVVGYARAHGIGIRGTPGRRGDLSSTTSRTAVVRFWRRNGFLESDGTDGYEKGEVYVPPPSDGRSFGEKKDYLTEDEARALVAMIQPVECWSTRYRRRLIFRVELDLQGYVGRGRYRLREGDIVFVTEGVPDEALRSSPRFVDDAGVEHVLPAAPEDRRRARRREHRLSISVSSAERILAHWQGYVLNQQEAEGCTPSEGN